MSINRVAADAGTRSSGWLRVRPNSQGTDRPPAPTTKAPPGVGAGPLAWADSVCALGGTRTPNLLIRGEARFVAGRP
jgi:hypothetical protein